MATVAALPAVKIDPHTGLPVGAPTQNPGESIADYRKRLTKWLNDYFNPDKQPMGPLPPVDGSIPNPLHAINSVGDFLAKLADPNTWVRVGEVVVGVICIAVGLSAMTKANPVAKGAKVAAKAAVL
jgi:hypothetical protein